MDNSRIASMTASENCNFINDMIFNKLRYEKNDTPAKYTKVSITIFILICISFFVMGYLKSPLLFLDNPLV